MHFINNLKCERSSLLTLAIVVVIIELKLLCLVNLYALNDLGMSLVVKTIFADFLILFFSSGLTIEEDRLHQILDFISVAPLFHSCKLIVISVNVIFELSFKSKF